MGADVIEETATARDATKANREGKIRWPLLFSHPHASLKASHLPNEMSLGNVDRGRTMEGWEWIRKQADRRPAQEAYPFPLIVYTVSGVVTL